MTQKLNHQRKILGRVSDTDIHLLYVFRTVVQCGGFSAAQSELGVGRSTISRQITNLETRLGFSLCHRGRGGFSLTQHGHQALEFIDEFLASADEFTSNIAGINDDFIGSINVAMIDYSFNDIANPMVGAIKRFHKTAPKVSINLSLESPHRIERGVVEGEYHLGILPDYRRLDGLLYTRLYDEQVELFVGGDHPLAEKMRKGHEPSDGEVFSHELVFRGYLEGEKLRDIKDRFPRGATVLQTESVIVLLEAGIYLGFLPSHCAHKDMISVRPDMFCYSVPICVATRQNRSKSLVLSAFLDELLPMEKCAD